jgi:hypothetical protein
MILDAIADLFSVDRAALAKASQSMANPPLPA